MYDLVTEKQEGQINPLSFPSAEEQFSGVSEGCLSPRQAGIQLLQLDCHSFLQLSVAELVVRSE